MSRRTRLSVAGRFFETVESAGLLSERSRVLVAVSGGADSVCLLELLGMAASRYRLTLVGFHLNHRLRLAAREDERFVRALFGRAEIPLTVVRADVRGYARRHGLGIEAAGRTLRYRHLARVARDTGCTCIALGHTADDNLETVVLNLVRGSGMSGLLGIPVKRGQFVRPLLDLTRSEVETWLRARRVEWREDESNKDLRFARNLVRHRVVPVLRGLNPDVAAAARRAARLLADEDDYLESKASDAMVRVCRRTRAGPEIDVKALAAYNVCLKRRMVRQLIPGLDASGVERVLSFLAGSASRLVLSGGVRLDRAPDGAIVRVTRKQAHGPGSRQERRQ